VLTSEGELTREFLTVIGGAGLFGIVENGKDGIIRAWSSKEFFEVPVINGAFQIPDLESMSGRVLIKYLSGKVRIRRVVIKDAAPYYTVISD
jgi:hypothetical protein